MANIIITLEVTIQGLRDLSSYRSNTRLVSFVGLKTQKSVLQVTVKL